ncbi:MAG: hypothetical protein FWE57_09005 [Chitinispirillia bacterium]|nr:hypothetical protein [Chitinispirillia bacterium]
MNNMSTDYIGWLPAVILPLATVFQLIKIIKSKSAEGVSAVSWFLFCIANTGLYIYTQKYLELQAILSMLLTAFLNLVIVTLLILKKSKRSQ